MKLFGFLDKVDNFSPLIIHLMEKCAITWRLEIIEELFDCKQSSYCDLISGL